MKVAFKTSEDFPEKGATISKKKASRYHFDLSPLYVLCVLRVKKIS